MTQAKHTPGPWEAQINPRFDDIEVHSDHGVRLADVNDVNGLTFAPERPEAIANARLMAAAPDLLEALEVAIEWDSHDDMGWPALWLEKAETAIAKAKGKDT